METAAAKARYDQRHKDKPYHDGTFKSWSKERGAHHPYHASEGVQIWVDDVDHTPDDDLFG